MLGNWFRSKFRSKDLREFSLVNAWRSPQAHREWRLLDPNKLFQERFSSQAAALLYYHTELSMVESQVELRQVLEGMLADIAQAQKQASLKLWQMPKTDQAVWVAIAPEQPKILPRSFSTWPDRRRYNLACQFFPTSDEAMLALNEAKAAWQQKWDNDHVEQFVTQRINQTFKAQALAQLDRDLDQLFAELDAAVSDTKATSDEYLFDVWRIPKFVFADDPNRAIVPRIQLEKAYQSLRPILYAQLRTYYDQQKLWYTLAQPFSPVERQQLEKVVPSQTHELVFELYLQLLERLGISEEMCQLFPSEEIIMRSLKLLKSLPDGMSASLSDQSLYALVTETVITFLLRHQVFAPQVSSERLLQVLLNLLIKRIAQFTA